MKNSILLLSKGKVAKRALGLFLFLFTLLIVTNAMSSPDCTLVAEDEMDLYPDADCMGLISVDMVLEDNATSCNNGDLEIRVYDAEANLLGTGDELNPVILDVSAYDHVYALVEDLISGNITELCDFEVTDNIKPVLECFEPLGTTQTYSLDGTEDTYHRSDGNLPPTCDLTNTAGSGDTYYDVLEFEVTVSELYTATLNTIIFPTSGWYIGLYENSFDKDNPCENLIDLAYTAVNSPISLQANLVPGTRYIIVTTTRLNGDTGDYSYTFVGTTTNEVEVKDPDCTYDVFCFDDLNEKIIIKSSDGCDSQPLVEIVEDAETLNPTCSGNLRKTIDRIYKATDASDNESTLLPVTIDVYGISELLFLQNMVDPQDVTLECNSGFALNAAGYPDPSVTGVPYLEINGKVVDIYEMNFDCNIMVTYVDHPATPNTSNPCETNFVRIWTIINNCGYINIPHYLVPQNISIVDTTPPVIEAIDDDVLTTNTLGTFENTSYGTVHCGAEYEFPVPQVTDNCQTNLEWDINVLNDSNIPVIFINDVDFNASTLRDLPLGVNTVIYRVYDNCSMDPAEIQFTVTVNDNTPPTTVCQTFTTVALTYDGEAEVHASSFDSGSYDDCQLKELMVRRMDEPGAWAEYVTFNCADINDPDLMVVLRSEDIFGNQSECMVSVEVQDKLNPIIEAPEDVVVECDFFYEEDELGTYFGTPTAHDNCLFRIEEDYTVELEDCWGDQDSIVKRIIRTFTAIDSFGLTGTDTQVIEFKKYSYFGYDAQGYTTGDANGQIIWPEDVEIVGCADPNSANDPTSPFHYTNAGVPTFIDEGPCDAVGWGQHQDIVMIENDEDLDNDEVCFKILRTWTVIDDCHKPNGGTFAIWTHHQYLYAIDTVPPEFQSMPQTVTTCTFDPTCMEGTIDLEYMISDNCTMDEDLRWSFNIVYDYDPSIPNQPVTVYDSIYSGGPIKIDASFGTFPIGTHQILWTIWDQCGNSTSKSQVVTIMNCTTPTILMVDQHNVDLTPMPGGPAAMVNANDLTVVANHSCGYPLTYAFSDDINDTVRNYGCNDFGDQDETLYVFAELPDGTYTYDYVNVTIQVQDNFFYCDLPDVMATTPLTVQMDTTAMGDTLIVVDAAQFDNGSSHPGNYQLIFSFSDDIFDTERTFTCSDGSTQNLEFFVTAMYGNGFRAQASTPVVLNITDPDDFCPQFMPQAMVSGAITDEFENAITGVQVSLEGSEFVDQLTDEAGSYAFPEMNTGGNYNVKPGLNENHANGVSTLDLIHIQKHLLGVQAIDSPYKLIAADVNKDESISASDLLEARELILGVNDQFTNNTSWRFVRANYEFENEANPLTENLPEFEPIENFQEDVISNFIAIKVGDVTSDANLNGSPEVETRYDRSLELAVDNRAFESGLFEVPVYAKDFYRINGFQFTLNFEPRALLFEGIEAGVLNINNNNYYDTRTGNVTVSWNRPMAIEVSDDTELFRIRFIAKQKAILNEVLDITSGMTHAEAYDADLDRFGVELNFRNLDVDNDYELYQNTPNPFSENTLIRFNMRKAGLANITIYDMNGKVIKVYESNYAKGINEITVRKEDLPVNGMLYYQMNTDEFSATKKMILIR